MKNFIAIIISAIAAFFALHLLKKRDTEIRAEWRDLNETPNTNTKSEADFND